MAKEFKLTKKNLIAAHNEIDEAVTMQPPIKESLGQDQYEKELANAIGPDELDLSDTEISGFSDETQEVLAALKAKYSKKKGGKKTAPVVEEDDEEEEIEVEEDDDEDDDEEDDEEEEEEEEVPAPVKKGKKAAHAPAKKPALVVEEDDEEEDEDEPSLIDQIKAARKLADFQAIVALDKKLFKGLDKEKNVMVLKKKMLALVTPVEDDDEEEEDEPVVVVPAKKEKKEAKKPAPVVVDEDEDDEEEEEEDEDEESLEDQINDASKVSELIGIAATNDEFKRKMKDLKLIKKSSELKAAMLAYIAPKKAKKAKKEKGESKLGVIAFIAKTIEDSGSKGVTRDEIYEKLCAYYPERPAAGMLITVNAQISNRISGLYWPIEKNKNGKYVKS